jgi:hypothetical protein
MDGRRLRSLALAAVALGCKASSPEGGAPFPTSCLTDVAPMPLVNLGPDVNFKVLCAGAVSAPVASVSELGAGITEWSISIDGHPAFSISQTAATTCGTSGVTVAQVLFQAPADAVPGDSFDAVVTVQSVNGAFAPGTVKVHADIVAVDVTVDRTSVDFGDVPANVIANQVLTFRNLSSGEVWIQAPPDIAPFVYGAFLAPIAPGQSLERRFSASAFIAGDYSSTGTWTATVMRGDVAMVPPSCTRTFDVAAHARIFYPPDPGDGGAATDVHTGSFTSP